MFRMICLAKGQYQTSSLIPLTNKKNSLIDIRRMTRSTATNLKDYSSQFTNNFYRFWVITIFIFSPPLLLHVALRKFMKT